MPGETAAEILSDDDFSKAFNNSALELTEETPPAKVEPAPAPKEEPAPAAAAAPAAKVEPEPAPAAKVEPEPAATPAAPASISEIVAEVLKATKQPEPAAAPEPEPADSPEVIAALADLESNWGTHKVAIETLLARQEKKLTAQFQEILKPLQEQVQVSVAAATVSAADKFKTELTAAHADAYTLIPDIEKWISEQPAYLQPAYNKVLDEGAVKDVADFITAFKTATGKLAVEPDPAVAEAKAAEEKAKAEKLARMEVTSTSRTSVTAEPDPTDFDSGWNKGAKIAS